MAKFPSSTLIAVRLMLRTAEAVLCLHNIAQLQTAIHIMHDIFTKMLPACPSYTAAAVREPPAGPHLFTMRARLPVVLGKAVFAWPHIPEAASFCTQVRLTWLCCFCVPCWNTTFLLLCHS
jgi:hypothetical protein